MIAAVFFLLFSSRHAQAQNIRYAQNYSGDLGQRIAQCIQAVPLEGGTCDASALVGLQLIAGTLVINKSNLSLLLPSTGLTHITSSACPIIQVLANNISIVGMGNSTVAVPDKGTTILSTSACPMVQIGDGAHQYRNVRIVDLRLDGNNLATQGIKYRGDIGYSKSERLELVNFVPLSGQPGCLDLTDGGMSQLEFDQIRCAFVAGDGISNWALHKPFHGQISFAHSLVQNASSVGWKIGNSEFTCVDCDGEYSGTGFKFISGPIHCAPCRGEGDNTTFEISMSSNISNLWLEGFSLDAQLPVKITSSNGSATLVNLSTAGTTGPYSISITGTLAGGQHILLNTGTLDKPINNQSAGNWRVM